MIEYDSFYDKIAKINGWDFSQVKCHSEGVQWDFYEEVQKRCKNTDILLDIGTGGGENVLKIAASLSFLIGIDLSGEMIKTARANLNKSNKGNVRFLQMSSQQLQFPDSLFDIISCRHAPFNATEVARVLKKGGTFLTQQVSEDDKVNLKEAFGRGQSFEEIDGTLKNKYIQELQDAGFSKVQSYEYDAVEYYQRPEDLLFLLTHTPIIPNFNQAEKDYIILHQFLKDNQIDKGIRTNSKRFMIIANN